ncbi:MAG: hypothetical protein JWM57_408, partial [Phycisphaerales bacterium]|nr:hypothetical protein [Phycisphaerales bacterium]
MQDSLNQGRGGLSSGRRMGSGRSTQAGVGNRARILRAAVEPLEQRRLLTTYYVSPAGSDAAAGTSAASPWASVTKVDATVFQPGDSILFQRGGEWHGQLEGSADGTAAAPIIYGDYGDTNLSKPIFEGSDYVPSNAFSSQGNSVYTFSTSTTGGKAYWVYLNHVALLAATSGSAAMPAGSFFVSGTTVWMNTGGVNPATAAVSVGVRATGQNADQGVIASNGHSYLTFNNLIGRETAQISGDGSLGGGIIDAYVIRVQGGTNVTLNNCEAYYGGKHHVGAIDTTKFLANGLTVSGGVNGVSGNTLPYGNSTALVAYADQNVHHTTQQWIDCTVSNYFGDQPAFLTHNDGADSIDSLLIQNLKSYGSPVALQPGNNIAITYRGGLISNNTLTAYGSTGTTELIDGVHVYSDNGSTGQKIEMYADNSTIQNCLVTGSGQVGGIQSYGSNATIRFNTVSMQGYASAAIQLGSASNATKLYGNITTGTGNALLINGSPTYTADYDLFDSTAGGPFIKVGSTTYSGIAAYRSATGQEAHGVVADPKFVSVGGGDYSLQSTSPAINLIPIGIISGVSSDIRGFARPSANVYDAGAFEYPSVLHQPTVATAASASANPVAGVTTNLSVLGASQDGESTLIYTWSLTGAPPATVTFNASATNAAKATTATFSKAGTYNFLVTISNGQFSATSAVSVVVNATPTAVVVTPASGFIPVNTTQQFTAALNDQFGKAITGQTIAYAVTNGGGTISPTGLYTAPATTGPATISAIIGGKTGTASITVTPPNQAPTIAIAASASPNPVTGVSTALSVLGADDNGESNLIYTWSLVGTPPAAVSYSVNGTNAAKSTLVTFTANGQYNFLVTVRDSGNLAATSTVSVTVNAIVPIVVDGSLDGRYGSPIVIQSQATNYGNGNLGSPTAPYSQLVAGYVVIDAANDKLNLFLAGSLNLNNAHLDLLIDSVASGGVAN